MHVYIFKICTMVISHHSKIHSGKLNFFLIGFQFPSFCLDLLKCSTQNTNSAVEISRPYKQLHFRANGKAPYISANGIFTTELTNMNCVALSYNTSYFPFCLTMQIVYCLALACKIDPLSWGDGPKIPLNISLTIR